MGGKRSLAAAKKAKLDEFYTRGEDIENELCHYEKHFRGKTVYCNCDDPEGSEFWKFFVRNFDAWGLKKLMATHYEPNADNYAYRLELAGDVNGDGRVDWRDKPERTPIQSNGDFRSACCIELLKEADVVVTNPPFSLFREYVQQLVEYGKKFIIVGPRNAITYKEIFPMLKDGRLWIGYGFNKGDAFFRVPPENAGSYAKGVYNPETGFVHFRNCTWFTNLDIPKRRRKLELRGTRYDPEANPKYANCNAIEVSRLSEIPCDWDGVMGVPVTFLDHFNPDQFEILGFRKGDDGRDLRYEADDGKGGRKTVQPYFRILVRNLHPLPRRAA